MENYVVRQPIKDKNGQVWAYEVLFSDAGSAYNQVGDQATADAIANFLLENNNQIFENKIAFMTFTPNLLYKNIPKIFSKESLVIQIEDTVLINPVSQSILKRYQEQGYKIAIKDFKFAPRYFSWIDQINYIKLNFENSSKKSLENILNMCSAFNKKCIAFGVNNKESYDIAMELGIDYVQGTYVAEKQESKAKKLEFMQSNFFQLVVAVTNEEPDFDEICDVIKRDISVTYALLKLVNSAYFAARNKTTSIMQALMILGLGQLKQWVYLLSFKKGSGDLDEHLIKTSFMRASFCSKLLPYADNMPISKSEAYMMGMFSTLGILMEAPLEDLLSELPIAEEIKVALLTKEGRCGLLYELILHYENADWNKINHFAANLNIPKEVIAQIYFDCVEEVNSIWNTFMSIPEEDANEQ